MTPLRDQTHYEVLDVPPDASAHEIQRAHQEARSLYGEDALASYSLFGAEERVDILARIDEAYAALSDAARRAAYDRSVGIVRPVATDFSSVEVRSAGDGDDPAPAAEDSLREKVRCSMVNGNALRVARRMAIAGVVTGRDLKQLRLALGLEVAEIEACASIGGGLISALEEDRFEDLSSWSNLRDSLIVYASLLQVNPEMVAAGYLKHFTARE